MATFGDILNSIALAASQAIRRNSTNTAFEAFTPATTTDINQKPDPVAYTYFGGF